MTLRLNGTTGYTEIDASATAGNNTLVLPGGNGSNRQVLIGDGAGALSFSWDAGSLFYRLDSNLAGANVNTAQSVLGVGVALAGSTVYAFEAKYAFSKSAGTTAHGIGVGFGGTATVNNILYASSHAGVGSSTPSGVDTTPVVGVVNSVANTTVSSGTSSSAATTRVIVLTGTVSINAGGTFIPQYTLSAAPGGAYSTVAGSYIKFTPIGAAGSASSQGTWS